MSDSNLLFDFETKYPFLYGLTVEGVPLYTCLRDHVLMLLRGGADKNNGAGNKSLKGRVFPKRMLDSLFKLPKLRRSETVIFTSSVYRRDHGRNLAAEYLTERYPNAVVFEWPSRNKEFDSAYFSDKKRGQYCPLDFYLVRYKLAERFKKRRLAAEAEEVRERLKKGFDACPPPETDGEAAAVRYLLEKLPESYAATKLSQSIFRKMFRKYRKIHYAIDFWGSARENIFPVLPGKFEKIELQHGLISAVHPGYIYPDFAKNHPSDYFCRTLLVYGEATKRILCEHSIFHPEQIEVIGNPRIQMYRREFPVKDAERNFILFTSQPFEQDGSALNYYLTVIPFLQVINKTIRNSGMDLRLAIKLHPREGDEILEVYRKALPDCELMSRSSDLYGVLAQSWLHVTANSTVLYEALDFDVPTVTIMLPGFDPEKLFWKGVAVLNAPEDAGKMIEELADEGNYSRYLESMKRNAEA